MNSSYVLLQAISRSLF